MSQKSNSFHVHVDATVLPPELYASLRALGMEDTMFQGGPEGHPYFAPNYGLTLKVEGSKDTFDAAWLQVAELVSRNSSFKGYVEGELIAMQRAFEQRTYKEGVPVPFQIKRRKLRGGNPKESFRASEFHLTLDKDASDPRLIESLLRSGLFGAYLPKKDRTALVLTIQSQSQAEIRRLIEAVSNYLDEAGGAAHAAIKEEIAIAHLLIGITEAGLPEVIDHVEYL